MDKIPDAYQYPPIGEGLPKWVYGLSSNGVPVPAPGRVWTGELCRRNSTWVVKTGGGDYVSIMDPKCVKWEGDNLNKSPSPSHDEMLGHVEALLRFIGEDPEREGLRETPARFLKAWKEWAGGYGKDPAAVLKTFEDGAEGVDEMVIVHNIPVRSKCEHHLADITGIAHVGYIPGDRIVGLSKLARVTDLFARRLQVQERLTNQIANAIQEHLDPVGVGVVLRCSHACMSTRGVNVHGSITTTSAMRGALRAESNARSEFLQLCREAEKCVG